MIYASGARNPRAATANKTAFEIKFDSYKQWVAVNVFTQHAMSVMGISPDIQNCTLQIVAGVLHLGNVDFVERNNYAEIANRQC